MIRRSPALATFAVMLVAIVGGGVLALPIALAQFGPILAGVVVAVMGLLSMFTMGVLALAVTRSASVAAGRGRLVTMASEHLGRLPTRTTTGMSVVNWLGHLVVYFLGLAGTLAAVFGGAPAVWSIGVGVVTALLILLQARRVFVASATVIAVVNLVLLVALIALVALHVEPSLVNPAGVTRNLQGWDEWRAALRLVFGAVLWAYFGHTAVFAIAPEVLAVEPSGRALLRGSVGAMFAATVINVTWVVVVLGSIPGGALEQNESTGVTVIARTVGGPFTVLATLFVVLAIGGGAANSAFALTDVVAELLPDHERFVALLRPGVSIEADEPTTATRIVVTVVERAGVKVLVARVRRGEQVATADVTDAVWDARELLGRIGGLPRRHWLRVTTEGALPDGILVRVDATVPLTQHPVGAEPWWHRAPEQNEIAVMRAVTRQPGTPDELAERLGLGADVLTPITDRLVAQGSVRLDDTGQFRAVLGTKRRMRSSSTASRLDALFGDDDGRDTEGADRAADAAARLGDLLGGADPAPRPRRAASRLDALGALDDPQPPDAGVPPAPVRDRLAALDDLVGEPSTPVRSPGSDPQPDPQPDPVVPAPEPASLSVDEQIGLELAAAEVSEAANGRFAGLLQSEAVRHAVRVLPVVVAIAVTVACIAAAYGFADLLSLIAIATIMFLGGVLPVLLGLAMRVHAERRGAPGLRRVWPLWVLFGIYATASGVYAIFIYQDVVPRVIAAVALVLSVTCMIAARRFGAFRPRSTVAVDLDDAGRVDATVLVAGQPRSAVAPPALVDSLTSLVVEVDGPVVSPVLVAARQGDGVPPVLETWQVSVLDADGAERFWREGAVSDVTGDLVDLPDDTAGLRVRWTLR